MPHRASAAMVSSTVGRTRVPGVGNNVETRIVLNWMFVSRVCDVRGLAVCGRRFGNTKRSNGQEARVQRQANRRKGEENNGSKMEIIRK